MEIELLFLGTGTSAGIPMIGCRCEVCRSEDPRDRRSRASVLVSSDGYSVLIDTAPELRLQCVWNGVERIEAVVFTHAHADHIMGLDDVRRFNTIRGGPIDVWADEGTHTTVGRCFEYAFRPAGEDPGLYRPQLVRRVIDGPFEIGPMRWIPIPLEHGSGRVLGFRIGPLAYCTDVSGIPGQSYALLEGVELLVLDGLRFREHPTHFSIGEAVQAARQVGSRRTYLTHFAHEVMHERLIRSLPAGIEAAYDGLKVKAGA